MENKNTKRLLNIISFSNTFAITLNSTDLFDSIEIMEDETEITTLTTINDENVVTLAGLGGYMFQRGDVLTWSSQFNSINSTKKVKINK